MRAEFATCVLGARLARASLARQARIGRRALPRKRRHTKRDHRSAGRAKKMQTQSDVQPKSQLTGPGFMHKPGEMTGPGFLHEPGEIKSPALPAQARANGGPSSLHTSAGTDAPLDREPSKSRFNEAEYDRWLEKFGKPSAPSQTASQK